MDCISSVIEKGKSFFSSFPQSNLFKLCQRICLLVKDLFKSFFNCFGSDNNSSTDVHAVKRKQIPPLSSNVRNTLHGKITISNGEYFSDCSEIGSSDDDS